MLELLPRGVGGSWGLAFAGFNHADFDARVAYGKSLGVNATKIACSGVTSGGADNSFPSQPKYEAYVQDYCQILRKYGMKHFHQISNGPMDFTGAGGGQVDAQIAQMMACYAIWVKHGLDLIIGTDVCNESNLQHPPTWGANFTVNQQMQNDLGKLLAAARAVAPFIPISFSVYMQNATSAYSQDALKLQATLGCDFHDYHSYNGSNIDYTVTPAGCPTGANMATLESQPWFIGRYFNSECGIPSSNTFEAEEAWLRGMKEQALRPASHGGVYFGDIDYGSAGGAGSSSGSDYGLTGHPIIAGAFAGWPARARVAATG